MIGCMPSFARPLILRQPAELTLDCAPRLAVVTCWQFLIFCALFSVMFLPEFIREGPASDSYWLYRKAVGGFRMVDLGIVALIIVHAAAVVSSRQISVSFPRPLFLPGVAFAACIATAISYGVMQGGTNFFFDWRGLALGTALYLVWAVWMQTPSAIAAGIRIFAACVAIRLALLYLQYMRGPRETLLGVPIPTFDGPSISALVFAALLALWAQETTADRLQKLFWMALAAACYVMVLLCFRRTYWIQLAIGTVVLMVLQRRRWLRNTLAFGTAIALAAVLMGQPLLSRMQAVNPLQEDNEFGADNSDHLHDLEDAWEQIKQSPILGIGVGTAYPTWESKSWKSESVMVHNALIHVWLKYGICGLVSYIWFHVALLWQLGRGCRRPVRGASFRPAIFAYCTAQFVTTMAFAPWPYAELQMTTLLSFVLAAAFMSPAGNISRREVFCETSNSVCRYAGA